ncbi:polysaccharide pyruvyl transferase family protein [Streptomyces sp. NPDC092369]|uniref:polysaccharide pyruvyl transferase family protein n=1 Tax=Streptomyces sp. NPDC092369 TaxID=3366015 RepID=UPI0038035672
MTSLSRALAATAREPRRLLLTGWFSFLDGEATAGDVLAQRRVSETLTAMGIRHDTAWSPGFRPGALSLEAARPDDYDTLLFVCGPLHGPQITGLHLRFAACRRLAAGVSVIDAGDPAVTGFDVVIPRDGTPADPVADLAASAPLGPEPPVVGVVLSAGQGEYGTRRLHTPVNETLRDWLQSMDCTRVEADTRLAVDDWRLCATPEQFLALVGRLDLVVTTRLHGLVLALRRGTPVIAVDPVSGGAKVCAQGRALRWPAVLASDDLLPTVLEHWWAWALSDEGREAARAQSDALAGPGAASGRARKD